MGPRVDKRVPEGYRFGVSDLFSEKAKAWDARPVPALISQGVGTALLHKLNLSPELRVMDFGAGTGLICAQIAPLVKVVYAVDISSAMLEQLAAKPELADRVVTVCQDILEQPLGKPVDLIVSAMAMHHVKDTSRLLKTFAEHLIPGGRVALADLDHEDGSFHPQDIEGVFHQGFEREPLRALLVASGFEHIEFVTALEVSKNERSYPIFLVTATKSA